MDRKKGSERADEIIASEYEIFHDKIIGHGAFAVVYKGRKLKDENSLVAIKAITKKNISKSQIFSKEIGILRQIREIKNDNIVSMITYQETNTHVYVVMGFCNGGDLSDYLTQKKTLSEETIRLFLIQIANAMKALKEIGIMHRDLKPQNILLDYDPALTNPLPSQITLKLADFGFARFLDEDTMAATLCGSPMYMAPEVIMSQNYNAKADLWSIGTITYQALTGRAPFSAPTPQALKLFYEKTSNLVPKVPSSTSPELHDFLSRLMKRNPDERMDFNSFYRHKFLRGEESPEEDPVVGDYPLPVYESSVAAPVVPKLPQKVSASPIKTSSPIRLRTLVEQQPESKSALSSSPEDDYVIVPKNGQSIESLDKEKEFVMPKSPIFPMEVEANGGNSSPPRPCTLPLATEPVPVPRRGSARFGGSDEHNKTKEEEVQPVSNGCSSVPRSLPISMKRQESKPDIDIDISSLSPPAVRFVIGTPPGGGRRRSTSSGSYSETPPPNLWTVSPSVTVSRTTGAGAVGISAFSNASLRRSGTSPPILGVSPLTRVPMLSSPNLSGCCGGSDNCNNQLVKAQMFATRAITLPEISEMRQYYGKDVENNKPMQFFAPELTEETLLGKEHNEILAKINFVLALSGCILTLAARKTDPLDALVNNTEKKAMPTDPKTERLVLLIRALQLLSSGLSLASKQIKEKKLQVTSSVKSAVAALNSKFKQTLYECRQVNVDGLISNLKLPEYAADWILFEHAVDMCQMAAADELFGEKQNCAEKYHTAQILLHSLAQQTNCPYDKETVLEFKTAVEKRLHILQSQGVIYTAD